MLQRFGQTDKADDAYWVAWACALAPDATKDWATAVALAEKAVQSDPKSATYLNTLGAVLYRAGRFDEALRVSRRPSPWSRNRASIKSPPAYTWFFLAMTQHRLGHSEEAKQWLDKAVAGTDKIFAEADQGTVDLPWNRRLTLKLLCEEAEGILKVRPPDCPHRTDTQGRQETGFVAAVTSLKFGRSNLQSARQQTKAEGRTRARRGSSTGARPTANLPDPGIEHPAACLSPANQGEVRAEARAASDRHRRADHPIMRCGNSQTMALQRFSSFLRPFGRACNHRSCSHFGILLKFPESMILF